VVRSDGSGSTAQLTLWMIAQYPSLWNAYCNASGRAPACGSTSYYPTVNGMIAQSGDLGVAGYVAQGYANGAIGYVNYSYALNAHFPVVKLLNVAGYYTEPTPQNVAVSLLQAAVDTTDVNDPSRYLTQQLGSVYTDSDPRAYELSSYSYLILPTTVQGQFSTAKGKTLAAFAYYAMCQGQQESASLGYSPMPVNLVQASFDQIKKIPGAVVENINITSCNNPTFSPSSPNLLADTAPMPQACDKQGTQQCSSGTGGAANQSTAVSSGSSTSGSSSSGSSSSGSSTSGYSSSRSSGSTGSGSGPSHAGTGTRSGSTRAPAGTIARTGATSAAGTGATAGGTGSAGTGGSTAGSSGTAGATGASTSATECDPSAGTCGGGAGSGSGGAAADPSGASTQSAAATPYTLTASGGWTGTQTLMVLVGILVVGLVVAPGVVYAYLASRDE
jgi:phosphate transport system substrate-binding protein